MVALGIVRTMLDYLFIGGTGAVEGWGLLVLFVISGGVSNGRIVVDPAAFFTILCAAALTGNGIYALNAYYDRGADKINKPKRPVPSGRITPENALRYSWVLIALGMFTSAVAAFVTSNYIVIVLWTILSLLGIAYSQPPVKLKARHIWGNLCFGAFAMLAMATGLILNNELTSYISEIPIWMLLLYASMMTISTTGMITMKDFYDYEGDKANNDISLPVKVGRKWAAVISIVIMAIPMVFFTFIAGSPSTVLEFIMNNWSTLILFLSFGLYIVIDYVGPGHYISDSYARIQYFYVCLNGAYGSLKGPLGLNQWISWELQSGIALAVFAIVAFGAVYQSRKAGYDVMKMAIGR